MVIKLDDTPGITKKEVQTTRQTQQTTQPQAKEQYNTSRGPVAQVIPGEQGRPDVVVYVIPEKERIQGTQVSIPDPYGHLDAFGNPVPGSKSAAPTAEEQKTITKYVQNSTIPANIDKNKLTNPLPQEQFKPTGQKVRIDLPQGGFGPESPAMFAATREYLLTLPNGTQVQIGDSKNDNVYVYNGGLAGQLDDDPELDYYTGYGGVTAGMAMEARQRYASQRAASGPYSGKNVAPVALSGVMDQMIKSRETEPYTPTVGDRIRAFVGNEQVDVKGVKLDPVMSKLVTGTYEANVWAGQKTEEFANFLGPKGSLRNELGMMIGWTASTPIGFAQFGADALALNEVFKKSPVSAVLQVQENWGVNTKAFEQTYQEHPRAAGTMFMLGALVGAEGAVAARPGVSPKGFTSKANVVSENAKPLYGSRLSSKSNVITENVKPVSGNAKPLFGKRFTGEKPNTKFDTSYITDTKQTSTAAGRARASAYDNGQKIGNVFESPSGDVYADLVNEAAGGEAINIDPWKAVADKGRASINANKIKIEPAGPTVTKTIEVNKKIAYTPNDRPVFQPFKDTDMNWAEAQKNIKISIGKSKRTYSFKENNKSLWSDDKASAQLLLQRTKTRNVNVDDMIYNSATRKTPTSRVRSVYARNMFAGSLFTTGSISAMIAGPSTNNKSKTMQIIGPGRQQRVPIPNIKTKTIQYTGQKTKPSVDSWIGTPTSPKPKTGTKTITDTTLMLGLGVGVGVGVGALTAGRMLAPGRMKGIGGDGSSYRRMFGSGMSREKYFTGDITSLINGKKKRRAKRR